MAKKIQFDNLSLRGIWNVIKMKRGEANFRFYLFGERVHHAYVGAVIIFSGMMMNFSMLNYYFGVAILTHDFLTHLIR